MVVWTVFTLGVVCGRGGLSGLHRGSRTFDRFCLQGQPNESSERTIFEYLYTEEVTGSGKAIFKGGFKFAASEARKNFNIPSSAVKREEDWSASPSTQEHQRLEGKFKHRIN